MSDTRIYAVTIGGATRLVEASNKAQAVHHVAKATITAEVAGQKRLVELTAAGVKVGQCGDSQQQDSLL